MADVSPIRYSREGKPDPFGIHVLQCRPEVQAYAVAMELALREHDEDRGPAGWKSDADGNVLGLLDHLAEEVLELKEVLVEGYYAGVCREAPHVGAMAMMILDCSHIIEARD
jgi:hypothetical protein